MFSDLQRVFAKLPKEPVAPENRGASRLLASGIPERGQVFRLVMEKEASELGLPEPTKPRIVMHPDDVREMRMELAVTPWARTKTLEEVESRDRGSVRRDVCTARGRRQKGPIGLQCPIWLWRV